MGLFDAAGSGGQKQNQFGPSFLEGLLNSGNLTAEQEQAIIDATGLTRKSDAFGNLPSFNLPPAPGFGQGFDAPFGNFTDFTPTGGVDESVLALLRESAQRDRITGFIPDQADFDANLAAQMDEIFARAGASREQLASDISARDIGGAGEIPRTLLRDIQGPAVRAAATVSAQAQLAFGQQVQAGSIAQEAALGASRGQLLDAATTNAKIASAEAGLALTTESQELLAANRNSLQKAIHDDSVTLEVYRTQINAQLAEYLSKMTWLTQTDVANIMGEWAARAAEAENKSDMWKAFGELAVTYFSGGGG